jgi:hypothetical protein
VGEFPCFIVHQSSFRIATHLQRFSMLGQGIANRKVQVMGNVPRWQAEVNG